MARDLVICCDGTGNQFGDRNSNVVKLNDCLVRDKTRVLHFYDPGVGTFGLQEALFEWQQIVPRVAGLAFGWGYRSMVERGYRFIAENYVEGDRIWLFGFSRGAYIARVIAGMIHAIGLLDPAHLNLFDYAFRIYERSAGDDRLPIATCRRFTRQFCRSAPIHFIGAFDTVKSIGWFIRWKQLPWTMNNPSVKFFRHAISIDERRCFFRTNLWRNGAKAKTDVRELWFAGVHSDVGGGYPEKESGLSKFPLAWMIAEAEQAGLPIDAKRRERLLGKGGRYAKPEHNAQLHTSLKGAWWLAEYLLPRRMIYVDENKRRRTYWVWLPLLESQWIAYPRGMKPGHNERIRIHSSVRDRINDPALEYAPVNLPKDEDGWPLYDFVDR